MFTDNLHSTTEGLDPVVRTQADDAARLIRDPQEFARALGLTDLKLSRELHKASGGWLDLARPVAEIASQAPLPADITSREFADYIATLVDVPHLGLSADDHWVLTALSHLSIFTKQSALLALSAVVAKSLIVPEVRDPESMLMRLRMSGGLIPAVGEDGRDLLTVPVLLAAVLRRAAVSRSDVRTAVTDMVLAFVGHLENVPFIDTAILSDVLVLARQYEQWSVLVHLQESFDLTLFLLAPQAACAAFAGLPAEAVAAETELAFSSMITEVFVAAAEQPITASGARDALVSGTRAGRMRDYVAESGHVERSDVELGYLAAVRRILALSRLDRHEEAATLGLSWRAGGVAKRAGLVVGLLSAMALFHSGQQGRALSILHEVEGGAHARHVPGDFLLPSAVAWTALVAAVSNDHERADLHLDAAETSDWGPCIVDELVSPAIHVAVALRALDRLDLDQARTEVEVMAAYPENRALWAYLPFISRTIGLLTAVTESGLLFINDDVEKYRNASGISRVGKNLLKTSRSMVYIALGQLKWAELGIEELGTDDYERIVLKAKVELVAGRNDSAIALVETWFYHQALAPRSRAELAAIKAAALLRIGREREAIDEFLNAMRLSTWVSSLLPLAFLPQDDRVALIDLVSESEVWDDALAAFPAAFAGRTGLVRRLRAIGTISVGKVSMPQLNPNEVQLLSLLSRELSIAEISAELCQVTGTVKNRLSALYRKFAVSNRHEVIDRAKSLGYLLPD